jgi:hypothetical protein
MPYLQLIQIKYNFGDRLRGLPSLFGLERRVKITSCYETLTNTWQIKGFFGMTYATFEGYDKCDFECYKAQDGI